MEKTEIRYYSHKTNITLIIEPSGDVIVTIDGIVYYPNYTNKLVPPDYKFTDEDKKAEANSKFVFHFLLKD